MRLPLERNWHSDGKIRSAHFSGDGRRLITNQNGQCYFEGEHPALPRGLAEVWDTSTLRRLAVFKPCSPLEGSRFGTSGYFRTLVEGVALDPAGKLALVGLNDRSAVLYCVESGRELQVLREPESEVAIGETPGVSFSLDGSLALVGFDRCVGIWRLPDGKLQEVLEAGTKPPTLSRWWRIVCGIQASEDLVFASCIDGASYLWRLPGGELVREATSYQARVAGMTRVNGRTLWATDDGTVRDESGVVLQAEESFKAAIFSEDGTELVAATESGCWRFTFSGERRFLGGWSPLVRSWQGGWLVPAPGGLVLHARDENIEFRAEGELLGLATSGRTLILNSRSPDSLTMKLRWYEFPSGLQRGELEVAQDAAWCAVDEKLVACEDPDFLVVDLVAGKTARHPSGPISLSRLIACHDHLLGFGNNRVYCWSLSEGPPKARWSRALWPDSDRPVRTRLLEGSGGRVVVRGSGESIVLSLTDGQTVSSFEPGLLRKMQVCDGALLTAHYYQGGVIREWCIENGQVVRNFEAEGPSPNFLFHENLPIEVWFWPGGPYPIRCQSVSPDRRFLLTRKCLLTLNPLQIKQALDDDIRAGCFTENGVLVCTADGELKRLCLDD